MAVVITVAQQKGGAGKTTLAANLAVAFSADHEVALIDIDPQRSLTQWHRLRTQHGGRAFGLADVSGWRLGNEIDRLRRAYGILLVDSPPQIDTAARVAIRAAKLVLVPVQPSAPDLWAAAGTLRLAGEEGRTARLVLNRVAAGRMRSDAEAEIARLGYPRLDTVLGNRASVPTAFARGLGITEAAPKSAAAEELRALCAEIEPLLA